MPCARTGETVRMPQSKLMRTRSASLALWIGFALAASFAANCLMSGPAAAATPALAAAPVYAPVVSGKPLIFPADFGSHPEFRTEWWYITGWLRTEHGETLGFQITFFRTKPNIDENNPSSFAPRQ